MPETVSRGASTGTFATAARTPVTGMPACGTVAPSATARPHRFRGRIGVGLAGGFYPAPHRYQLYLSEGCQRSLRVSITLALLGLENSTATTVLTRPAETPDAFASLRRAYEATCTTTTAHSPRPRCATGGADASSATTRPTSCATSPTSRNAPNSTTTKGPAYPRCGRRPSPRRSTPCVNSSPGTSHRPPRPTPGRRP
ncbi:hypothetical protein [Streptomyces tauricus]|uniref:hypothetical protein n=1 Tax=Streptomyces tauricus TaxID=68274 RepID=UPI0033AC2AFC